MNEKMERDIDIMRKKMDELWEKMSADDFARVHSKFFGAILSVEQGFKKKFPKEWKKYQKEFFGDNVDE